MNNVDEDTSGYSLNQDFNLLDNNITIKRWINNYYLRFSYDLPIKTRIVPYLIGGLTERVQLYSEYNSNIKNKNDKKQ